MLTLREIKRRIDVVKNLKKITKAMKMVANVNLNKVQNKLMANREFCNNLTSILSNLLKDIPLNNILVNRNKIKKKAYILITSDRGLVGGFNSNLLKFFLNNVLLEKDREKNFIFVVGKKGKDILEKENIKISKSYIGKTDTLTISPYNQMLDLLAEEYINKKIDALVLVYNSFLNFLSQQPTKKVVLPFLELVKTREEKVLNNLDESKFKPNYYFEPSSEEFLKYLVPFTLKSFFLNALIESKTAEYAARMTTMDNATKNTEDILEELKLKYNHLRQTIITQEIAEIINGASIIP